MASDKLESDRVDKAKQVMDLHREVAQNVRRGMHAGMQAGRYTDRHADRLTGRQAGRQAGRREWRRVRLEQIERSTPKSGC